MKKITLLVAFAGMLLCTTQAQLSLVGLHWNDQANQQEFVKLNTFSGTYSVIDTILGVTAVAVNHSAFNSVTGNYIFYGRTASGQMYQYHLDAITGNIVSQNAVSGQLPIGAQWDMRTGKVYALEWDATAKEEWLVELNINTGVPSRIGKVPGVKTVQYSTFVLDHANGEFYFIGHDVSNMARLYRIDVSNAQIISNPVVIQNMFALEYDVTLGKLIGITRPNQSSPMEVIEIDPATANYTTNYTLNSLSSRHSGVALGSVDFDQTSHTYVFAGRDNGADSIYLVDIVNQQHRAIQRNHSNELIIEVACDNTVFAKTYFQNATSIDPVMPQNTLQIAPNPVSAMLHWKFDIALHTKHVLIHDLQGKLLIEGVSPDANQLDVQALRPGSYILSVETEKGWLKKGFLKL